MYALVFEDNKDLRGILSAVLESAGFEVVFSETIQDGVAHIVNRPPDLAIVEGDHETLDALKVCRRLRGLRKAPQLPIIFLASRSRDVGFFNVLRDELSVDLVLQKPLNKHILVSHARRLSADVLRDSASWYTPPSLDLAVVRGGDESIAPADQQMESRLSNLRGRFLEKASASLTAMAPRMDELSPDTAPPLVATVSNRLAKLRVTSEHHGVHVLAERLAELERVVLQVLSDEPKATSAAYEDARRKFGAILELLPVLSAEPAPPTSGAKVRVLLALSPGPVAQQCSDWLGAASLDPVVCDSLVSLEAFLADDEPTIVLISDAFDSHGALGIVARSRKLRNAVQFILLVNASDAGSRRATFTGGFTDYLLIPLVQEELIGKIERTASLIGVDQ